MLDKINDFFSKSQTTEQDMKKRVSTKEATRHMSKIQRVVIDNTKHTKK